jgi:predicted alpha-1,2-mannosidase
MKKSFAFLCLVLVFSACKTTEKTLVGFVNPMIGTAPSSTPSTLRHSEAKENNSQVVPFVTVPFGMTNWTAQTQATEIKCVSPYYYKDSIFTGFRGSHWLSGSCVQDYGSMTIMPVSGALRVQAQDRGVVFSHKNEMASPFLYTLDLVPYQIKTAMTATSRAGLFEFTFGKEGEAHVVVNPNSDEGQGYVKVIKENNEIVGYNPVHRIYQGSGTSAGFSGYFVVRFQKAFSGFGVYEGQNVLANQIEISDKKNLGGYATFNVKNGEKIFVKIGTSFTSIEEARKNLDAETTNLSFAEAVKNLKASWEKTLQKVNIETPIYDDKVKFYTAMYHSFLHPRTYSDVSGSYPKFGGGQEVMKIKDGVYYSDFSMWDTYRALHPLFNLLIPKRNGDMMQSLMLTAKQGGWLPIFPMWNSYTSAMIGDHAVAAIGDAYIKNNVEISEESYQYLLKNAFESPATQKEYLEGKGRRGLTSYLKYGYVPLEDKVLESFHKGEQVSRTLEYAFDDFVLSQIAQKKGDAQNAEILKKRALNYKNVYSPADSTVRGRFIDGSFTDQYDKFIRMPYITEGTPYQYTWYVPQDIAGLAQIMGGEQAFAANLDRFHAAGQYWHGNEPGHQIPFLYNYVGQPWKTQKLVREILESEYDSNVGGLSGNDDGGQMSAWYVFAAMGLYPVSPGVPEYIISGPQFEKLTIKFENGNVLKMEAKGASQKDKYIQKVIFNGKEISSPSISHFELIKGGRLVFVLGNEPSKTWGITERPYSISK